MVQSGNNITVHKFQNESDDSQLNYRVVYLNVCGKYGDMTSMASRTLLVDPKDEQKKAYELAHEAHEKLIQNITVGKTIGEAYQAAKQVIEAKNKDLLIHNNFGFGIGFNFKEDSLLINSGN